jgi:hypothetical protein
MGNPSWKIRIWQLWEQIPNERKERKWQHVERLAEMFHDAVGGKRIRAEEHGEISRQQDSPSIPGNVRGGGHGWRIRADDITERGAIPHCWGLHFHQFK